MPGGWCRTCGAAVTFDARQYAARGLKPPQLCAGCRAARRARLVAGSGIVTEARPRVARIRADSGEIFPCFELQASLEPGQRVRFSFDPKEERPIARSVEPEHDGGEPAA